MYKTLVTAFCASCLLQSVALGQSPLTVKTGALFLHRSTPESCDIFVENGAIADVIDAEDYDFDLEEGFFTNIALDIGNGKSIIAQYYETDWDLNLSAGSTNGIHVNNNGFGMVGSTIADGLITTLDSDLLNIAIGLRQQVNDWLGVSASCQHLSIDDSLWGQISNGITPEGIYRSNTDNDLTGVRLGLDVLLLEHGRKRVTVDTGLGLFANEIENYSYYNGISGLNAYTQELDRTSVSYDLNVDCAYQVAQNLAIGVGYQLLLVDGVALGTDQALFTNYAGNVGTNDDSTVLFQGLNIFASFTY